MITDQLLTLAQAVFTWVISLLPTGHIDFGPLASAGQYVAAGTGILFDVGAFATCFAVMLTIESATRLVRIVIFIWRHLPFIG